MADFITFILFLRVNQIEMENYLNLYIMAMPTAT